MDIPQEISISMRALGRSLSATPFQTLLSAYFILLHRVSAREDILVGMPTSIKPKEYKDVMGYFVNMLPLRASLNGENTFAELVAKIKTLVDDATRHRHLPFSDIVRHAGLKPNRRGDFLQSSFAWERVKKQKQAQQDTDLLVIESLASYQVGTSHDLTLSIYDDSESLSMLWNYKPDAFQEDSIRRLSGQFLRLMEAILKAPESPIQDLALMPQAEMDRVLEVFNRTNVPLKTGSLHYLFEEQAARNPDARAILHGEKSISYGELNKDAEALAHVLRSQGIDQGSLVAICMERSVSMVVSLLAILKSGAAYIPMDPAYPADRLNAILEDGKPTALLTESWLAQSLGLKSGDTPVILVDQLESPRSVYPANSQSTQEGGLAYVIFTSGSTGRPKGVMVEHQGAVNLLAAMGRRLQIQASDRLLAITTLSFDISVLEIFLPLTSGAALYLASRQEASDPAALENLMDKHGITILQATPATWRMLLDTGWKGKQDLKALCGGEAMTVELSQWLKNRVGELWNVYGPTESTIWSTAARIDTPGQPGQSTHESIGQPLDNTRIYVLDAKGRPVPIGVTGEIHIGGMGVARGYLNNAVLTAERFLPDPFSLESDARMYQTGDLGRWLPDGALECLGRNDFQVKIRGFRIELGEIESRLLEHPAIHEAVAKAWEERLVAYVVADASLSIEEMKQHAASRLPDYMVPAAFVKLDALPLTPNKKVDRKRLPEPDASAYARAAFEAPQGELEQRLAGLWSELLGIPQISRNDSFFELGGHSLQTVMVASRLREDLGMEIPIGKIFDKPILRELAESLAALEKTERSGGLPPILPTKESGPRPLSFAQARLWFLSRFQGSSEAYHIAGGLRLQGALDIAALRQALNHIVGRHESLRTRFATVNGEARQIVESAEYSHFMLLEQKAESDAARQAILQEEAAEPFNLETGPLVRGRLLQEGEDRYTLLITMHHIISDGWSLGIMLRELSAFYRECAMGEAAVLPALPIQYADYAAWQRQVIGSEALQHQTEYWKKTLTGAPDLLELPTDHPRPSEQSFAGATVDFSLDASLWERLKNLSIRNGATPFMTLMAGWASLLARYANQDDIVLGTPVANRSQKATEALVGFFVNTLAIRLDLSGDPTVRDLLAQTRTRTIEAQAHQDIPFEQVVESINPPRSLAHSPLFQAMFAWQNYEEGDLSLPDVQASILPDQAGRFSKFDLTLLLGEQNGQIKGWVEYATALFERKSIEQLLASFVTLLEEMTKGDTRLICQLPLLPSAERQKIIETWNATEIPLSSHCLHEIFEKSAQKRPGAVAVQMGQATLTYGELNAKANRLAHHLRRLGVGRESRVAICMDKSFEAVTGLLGILKAGGAYVPLDPGYPVDRLRHMLSDSRAAVVLTRDGLFQQLGILSDKAGGEITEEQRLLPETLPILDLRAQFEDCPDSNLPIAEIGLANHDLAYVIYTSGSTGLPKGVMIDHRGAVNTLQDINQRFQVDGSAKALSLSSFSFDLSVFDVFGLFATGGTLVLPESAKADPILWQETIRQAGVTLWNSAPPLMQLFMDAAIQGNVEPFPSVTLVMLSGDWIPVKLPQHIKRFFPNAKIFSLGGATEASIWSVYYPIQEVDAAWRSIPYGKPLGNQTAYVLDKAGNPCPVGVSGELHIGGIGVALGYQNRPELTETKFIPDPFADAACWKIPALPRLYMTGDLCRWLPDGNLEIMGRNDFQVKIRGYRIELGEIEARLAEHPQVLEAVVTAREDVPGGKQLVAYVITHHELSTEDLRKHLSCILPEYMIPAAFVSLKTLPLTPNGKLDRRALPAPGGAAFATREYVEPLGEKEKILAEIWAELLKVERVGRFDNFFELGGHSLLTVTLIERMRAHCLYADVRAIFSAPTLEGLAAATDRQARNTAFPDNLIPEHCDLITPEMVTLVQLTQGDIDHISSSIPGGAANIQDIYPLAPLQEGILFHHMASNHGDAFLLPTLLAFDGRNRMDAFIQGLELVVRRHDILRTAILWEDVPEPLQVVCRQVKLHIEEIEVCQDLDVAEQLKAHYDPSHYRLDVRKAPLLHLGYALEAKTGRWILMFLLHHLAGDHTTLEVIHQEIQAFFLRQTDSLPKAVPFRHLVAQARLGVSQEEHEAFFRKMLGDVDEPTAPFGLLDVQRDGSGTSECHLPLDQTFSRRIRESARRNGVSAGSLCHHAWAQVLSRLTGQDDVVFGTILFGRMQGSQGADRAIGLFINTLPIRIRLHDKTVAASVKKTHATLAELMEHEHASLALAQRCSAVHAPMPLFTAPMNYRHSVHASSTNKMIWEGVETLTSEEHGNYPISLDVDDLGDGFILTTQTVEPIDPKRICQFMHQALEVLVEALEKAPETPVMQLDTLPDAERVLLLNTWNATERHFPGVNCLGHEIFERQVEKNPEACAVIQGETRLSYRELNARSNRLAHRLRKLGVGPERCVALCLPKSIAMLTAMLGVLKAGGAYIPMDPTYPKDRLIHMLRDASPMALLTESASCPSWQEALPDMAVLDALGAFDESEANPIPEAMGLHSGHLAYVCYTSGSTGLPKGVMVEHRSLWNLSHANQRRYNMQSDDRILQFIPYHFDGSIEEIFGAFLSGASLVLREDDWALDAASFWQKVSQHHITIVDLPTRLWQVFAMEESTNVPECLRMVIIYGEAVEERALRAWFARQGHLPRLFNTYGPTETTVNATIHELTRNPENWKSLGGPLDNVTLFVLDQHFRPAPIGVPGELYIGGAGVARGYMGSPEQSAERFLPNPFPDRISTSRALPEQAQGPGDVGAGAAVAGSPDRIYKTGDLVCWLPDGTLQFIGRNDFQVKIRGFRIELGEIESRMQACPGIKEAVVIAREDVPGDKRLVAYTIMEDGYALAFESLRDHLLESLPEYMIPAACVSLSEIPLTSNGKLDRKALPAPESYARSTHRFEAPQGEVEERIAELWSEILKVSRISRFDNFFELGGHSLLTITLMERLRQNGIHVDVRAIFDTPTLADLANAAGSPLHQMEIPANLLLEGYASTQSADDEEMVSIEI